MNYGPIGADGTTGMVGSCRAGVIAALAAGLMAGVSPPATQAADVIGFTGATGGGQPHDNRQPATAVNFVVTLDGTFPQADLTDPAPILDRLGGAFTGEITMFGGNFNPRGTALAQGQLLPIATNDALFSLAGTTFGGDGRTTLGLPDLRGRSAIHSDGFGVERLGTKLGSDTATLTTAQMPGHTHPLGADPFATESEGGGQSHSNRAPTLGINHFISLADGTVRTAANSFAPFGFVSTEGQLLEISSNPGLFSVLGTTYGGNGTTHFAVPDLTGRVVVGAGSGPGLTPRTLGETFGANGVTLAESEMPEHRHTGFGGTGDTGGGAAHNNVQESIALNYIIATRGIFPSRDLIQPAPGDPAASTLTTESTYAEILLYAGSVAPDGYAFADGSLIAISSNQGLFSLLGTIYGGDGQTTFGLPDFRGRTAVGAGNGAGLVNRSLGSEFGSENTFLSVANLPGHIHGVVPEPATLALLGLGGVALAGRRRRA